MMALKGLTFILLTAALLSCKPANKTSDLKVTIGPRPTNALPIAIASCSSLTHEEDLSPPTFSFTTFNYQWTGEQDYRMAYIQIVFRNGNLSGGKYECFIAGNELIRAVAPESLAIPANDQNVRSATCGLRCGGMVINSSVSSVYLVGTAKVVGTQVDAEGNSEQVVTETEVSVRYERP